MQNIARIAFGLLLLAVLAATLLPQATIPVASWNDKLQHAVAFFGLALLSGLGWPKRLAPFACGLLLLGATIEVLQGSELVGRDPSLADCLADSVGVLLGVACATSARRIITPLRGQRATDR